MHLIITEKHDAASRISGILSEGASQRSSVNGVPTYTWDDKICIGLAGHVVEVDFPSEYNSWNDVPPRALVTAPVEKRPSKPDIVDAVQQLSRDRADSVTIATDFDREGELIGKEAYDLVTDVAPDIEIDRVRFSSITPPAINDAFDTPERLDFNLAAAGEARQEIDLVWGASLTRFLTLAAERGGDVLSVGRVQTPTLKIVVDREREIENFDPDQYWEIYTTVSDDGDGFEAQYFYIDSEDETESDRIWSETIANSIHNDIASASSAVVEDADSYTRTDTAPIPFDTTEFISAANAIGYEAKRAMSIAEDLYTDGHITYPRTDNTVYPEGMDEEAIFDALAETPPLEDTVKTFYMMADDEFEPTKGDTESTDHPPIHPTTDTPNISKLSDAEADIYELVCRRFLATFSPDAEWEHVRLDLEASGHLLKATGRQLSKSGYHAVYPYYDNDESVVPLLDEGETLSIEDVSLAGKETRPPNRYGQSSLIEEMERRGLGTKSTRHNTVDTLYNRDYITDSTPHPTETGRAVIRAIEEYASQVATEDMTASLEEDMTSLAEGEQRLDTVTDESREMLDAVFEDLEGSESEIAEMLSQSGGGGDGESNEQTFGSCTECGDGEFVARESQSGSKFLGCANYPDCDATITLPNKGRPHALDEICDEHGLPHVKMIAGSQTFVHGCPACQQEEANETEDRVIGDCPECGDGNLAIKRVQTGSRLVGCTEFPDCDYAVPLPRNGDIEVSDEDCEEHALPELIVHPEDGSEWRLGCPICNAN